MSVKTITILTLIWSYYIFEVKMASSYSLRIAEYEVWNVNLFLGRFATFWLSFFDCRIENKLNLAISREFIIC